MLNIEFFDCEYEPRAAGFLVSKNIECFRPDDAAFCGDPVGETFDCAGGIHSAPIPSALDTQVARP